MEVRSTGKEIMSPDLVDGNSEKYDDVDVGLSPLSSRYSSCGESEFDRYCSANSAMGTPSVCSSMGMFHDSMDSDFGLLKGSEGFNLGSSRLSRSFEESSHTSILNRERKFGSCSNDAFCGSSPRGDEVTSYSEVGKKENLAVLLKNVENVFLQGAVAVRSAAEDILESNHADEMEDERCREEDETSSRYEHSDGEDSMFNYDSDYGSQPNAYYVKNTDDKRDEDARCGNLVLMNSSVAFGSQDWEDFELDTTDNQGIQLPDDFLEPRQLTGENADFISKRSSSKENVILGNDLLEDDKSFAGLKSGSSASLRYVSSGPPNQIVNDDGSDEYLESCSMDNIFMEKCSPIAVPFDISSTPWDEKRENQGVPCDKPNAFPDNPALQQHSDLVADSGVSEASFTPVDVGTDHRFADLEQDNVKNLSPDFGDVSNSVSSWLESDNTDKARNHDDLNLSEDKFTASQVSLH